MEIERLKKENKKLKRTNLVLSIFTIATSIILVYDTFGYLLFE